MRLDRKLKRIDFAEAELLQYANNIIDRRHVVIVELQCKKLNSHAFYHGTIGLELHHIRRGKYKKAAPDGAAF